MFYTMPVYNLGDPMKFIVTQVIQSAAMMQNLCFDLSQEDKQPLSLNLDLYALGDDAWIGTSMCPNLN